jgi:hypothetical protein
MGELKYVTDQELIDKYKAEASRKAWFGNSEWVFTPNVDPDKLILLSYDSVPDIYGRMNRPGPRMMPSSRSWARRKVRCVWRSTKE